FIYYRRSQTQLQTTSTSSIPCLVSWVTGQSINASMVVWTLYWLEMPTFKTKSKLSLRRPRHKLFGPRMTIIPTGIWLLTFLVTNLAYQSTAAAYPLLAV
ncbi:hypothetical protein FRC07_014511, partial [Ceratobasidium sp. 392]